METPRNFPPEEAESNVSPAEQADKDEFVTNGLTLIYDKKMMPLILQRLHGASEHSADGTDAIEGLAQVTVMIVTQLQDSAAQSGTVIASDILLHGGKEILEDLADLAGRSGIHDYTPEEIEGAFYRAMDLYRAAKPVDEEALQEDAAMLQRADREGTFDQIAPGVREHFAAREAPQLR